MQNQDKDLGIRKVGLALVVTVLCLFLGCQGSPELKSPPEVMDHRVEVKIDKTEVIAPPGSGIGHVMMSMVRHPDGTIFLNTQSGPLYKSTDNARTWTAVPVKLPAAPPKQQLQGIGVSRDGRLWLLHQSTNYEDLFVSYSTDGAQTWNTTPVDYGQFSPRAPRMTYKFCYNDHNTFIERPDGTVMWSVGVRYPEGQSFEPEWDPRNRPGYLRPADAEIGGEVMFRSSDGGKTWGDPTLMHSYVCEVSHAVDPYAPDHILSMTRIQRALLQGEDRQATLAKTGAPESIPPQQPSIFKNGLLLESTDGGRTFKELEGSLTGYYGHRGTICWADNNVVVVAHNYGGSGDARRVVRISLDGGKMWVDGTQAGTPFMNKSTKFLLAPAVGFSSPTIELSANHFLTAAHLYPAPYDDLKNPPQFRGAIVGVFWHLEKSSTAPDPDETVKYWHSLSPQLDLQKTKFVEIGPVWKIRTDPEKVGLEEKWYSEAIVDSDWAEVRSDKNTGWNSQGIGDYTGYAWYRTSFNVPENFFTKDNNALCFGAVDEEAEVYINGKKVFDHTRQSTGLTLDQLWPRAFSFDPSPYLRVGQENLIAVRVHNQAAMGGIWKPVYLLSTDEDLEKYLRELIERIRRHSK